MSTRHGFKLVNKEYSEDLESDLLEFEHLKSGARLAVISNEDPNKVFYIGFMTPSENSTGVAHILEHSTLTGSRKYPVKEPFVELVKGSLNTFLNAMTYADRTVYPVASTNKADFRNLEDVYLDAVFYPKVYDSPYTFMQEGWHYHLEDEDDDLNYNGVVYNEMKGVYSDPDVHVERLIDETLFPDTIYKEESGGDPENIPELTYEDFLNFHKKFYHPSNSRIYLYGDIDVDEELSYLDSWLSEFDKAEVDSEIEVQKPFEKRVYESGTYPIIPGEDTKNKDYLTLSYVFSPNLSSSERLTLSIAADFLLGDNASILKKALIEADLAGEVDVLLNTSTKQPVLTIFLKNGDASRVDEFTEIVDDVLNKIVSGDYDVEKLEAIVNSNEFRTLELLSGDSSNFPKGLIIGLNMLEGWSYGNGPFSRLDFSKQYQDLRDLIKEDRFGEFIKDFFINNPHQAVVTLTPDENMLALEEKRIRDELKAYKESLSEDEIKELVSETKNLMLAQTREDSEEDLKKIPHLSLSDLPTKPQEVDWEVLELDGVPLIYVEGGSKDIVYTTFEFDLSVLNEDELEAYSIFEGILGILATENYDFEALNKAFHKYTGGFNASTYISENILDDTTVANFKFQLNYRAVNTDEAVNLLKEVLLKTVFDDKELIRSLVTEMRLEDKSEILSRANASAALRLKAYLSESGRLAEKISGIEEYEYISELDENFDERFEDLKKNLESIVKKLFNKNSLTIGLACRKEYFDKVTKALESVIADLDDSEPVKSEFKLKKLTENEAFVTAGNVNYNAKGGRVKKEEIENLGALKVLSTILSMDYLWNRIRVLGGAYGTGFKVTRSGDIYMTSFRDPNLEKTYENYDESINYLKDLELTEDELVKYIIGTISPSESPLSVKQKLRYAMSMYFTGLTNEDREEERNQILKTDLKALKSNLALLEKALGEDLFVTIGTDKEIKENADRFKDIHTIA